MRIPIISNEKPPAIDGVGDYSAILVKMLGQHFSAYHISRQHVKGQKWTLAAFYNLAKRLASHGQQFCILQYVPYGYDRKGLPFNVLFFSLLLKWHKIQLVIFFHEVAIRPKGIKYGIISFLQRLIANLLLGTVKKAFTSIEFYKEKFVPSLRKKIEIAHIPSNFEFVEFESLMPQKKTSIVCFANRLTSSTLKWMAEFSTHFENSEIQVIGSSVLTIDQPQDDNNKYTFLGKLSPNSLSAVLSQCSLYIQLDPLVNGKEGGISLKSGALAANMRLGNIIIANRGDMTDPKLKHGHNIFFANQYTTPQQVATEIIKIMREHQSMSAFRANVETFYKENLSWDIHIKKYLSILKMATAESQETISLVR